MAHIPSNNSSQFNLDLPRMRGASVLFLIGAKETNMLRIPLLMAFMAMVLAACGEQASQSQPPPPPTVDVAKPITQSITEWDEFTGRFSAVKRVEIRARVTGYLKATKFRDGQMVEAGEVLYEIDPRSFDYEVARATAEYELSKKAYDRAIDLRKSQSIALELVDERLQELQVSEAALNEAKLNLSFTKITSPISGRISEALVDVGNLVNADSTLLTSVVSVNPIHFEFEGSQADFLKYTRMDRAGIRPSSSTSPNPIVIKLLDEETYGHYGRMDFVDNVVDQATGTIKGRALVENNSGIIYPGLFGRARLLGSGEYEAVLLPENAINTDQNRKYVYRVDADNSVHRTYITVGPLLDNGLVIIREGLVGSESIVVNGFHRLRGANRVITPNQVPLEWTEIATMPNTDNLPSLEVISSAEKSADVQGSVAAD